MKPMTATPGARMAAVVIMGNIPATGIIHDPVAMRVDDSATPEASLAFVDHMARVLAERSAVLVVYPAWRAAGPVRLVRFARGMLNTDRIAGIALDLPPLSLSVVADQMAFIAPFVRPGVLASLASALARQIYAGAWVNSVAHLEHIQTRLGAHVTSYLPGSGFSVAAAPSAGVHRITSARPVQEIAQRPQDPVLLLAADVNGNPQWLAKSLQPALGAVSLTTAAGQPLGQEYWGTKKYTEFVAFSGHPHALNHLVASTACRPCGWCGEPTALPACPFCAMVQPVPGAGRPETAGPGVPRPAGRPEPTAVPVPPPPQQPPPPRPQGPPANGREAPGRPAPRQADRYPSPSPPPQPDEEREGTFVFPSHGNR
ncbi:hypothetical protein [Spirillospora sp. NPDC029432]|uniref:hypothetical protein n=1 Tax=Spirillospora sp. NPDC029432 TaxID=3154599 RepID=UPI0034536E96